MKTTLTVRLDARQTRALASAARRLGKSASAVVRDALDSALTERTIAARAGHVRGRLRLSPARMDRWRRSLRNHNWRP